MNYEYIGYTGSMLISINLIPQIIHIYKIKNADSLSNLSIFLNILASLVMITYGVFIIKIPIIISNSMIMLFYGFIGYFKYIYQIPNKTEIKKIKNLEDFENQANLEDLQDLTITIT